MLGENDEGKDVSSFGGAASSDEGENLLGQLKRLNVHVSLLVAGEIPMPILAVSKVPFGRKGQRLLTSVVFEPSMQCSAAPIGTDGTCICGSAIAAAPGDARGPTWHM